MVSGLGSGVFGWDGWGGFWTTPQSFGTANWDDLLEMIRKSADSSNHL